MRHWVVPVLFSFVILLHLQEAWRRIVHRNPGDTAYTSLMTIDSKAYLDGAREMQSSGHLFFTRDTYHSVGMQVILGFGLRWFGERVVGYFKMLNFVLLAGTILLGGLLAAHVMREAFWGWGAAVLIASSQSLLHYTAILQYEVLVGSALLALCALLGRRTPARYFLLGSLVALLSIIRVHFQLLLFFLLVWELAKERKFHPAHAAALVGFAWIALPWNAHYSWMLGEPFWFQGELSLQAHRFLSPASQGFNFPFPPVTPPSGLAFVLERPLDYLSLLGKRFLYLVGWLPGAWDVPSTATLALRRILPGIETDSWVHAASGLLSIAGWMTVRGTPFARSSLLVFGTLLLPHLVINSDFRFLIPSLPVLAILQIAAVKKIVGRWEKKRRGKQCY